MDLYNNFYTISIPLNFDDTIRLCRTSKNVSSLCTDNYWNRKAIENYQYDLRYAVGRNNAEKYKWVEKNINIVPERAAEMYKIDMITSHKRPIKNKATKVAGNIIDARFESYFWNKKIERDFGIKNLYPKSKIARNGQVEGAWLYRIIYRVSQDPPAYYSWIENLITTAGEEGLNFIAKYGITGYWQTPKVILPIELQNDIKEAYNPKSDVKINPGILIDKWLENKQYRYIGYFLKTFYTVDDFWDDIVSNLSDELIIELKNGSIEAYKQLIDAEIFITKYPSAIQTADNVIFNNIKYLKSKKVSPEIIRYINPSLDIMKKL